MSLIAKAIILDPSGCILMLRRSASAPRRLLTWDFPGGMVEFGEDPLDAAKREAEEEAGQILDHADIVKVTSHVTGEGDHAIMLFYEASSSSQAVRLSFEHDQFKWVTKHQIERLDSPDWYKEAVEYLR